MKNIKITLLIVGLSSFLFCSCQTTGGSYSNTKTGVGTGALLGSGLGAIIGHQSGETGEGALVGAAAGAALGGLFGSAKDSRVAKANQERMEERNRMIAEANIRQQQAESERKRRISLGASVQDPDLLSARQRAEAAEAEVLRLKKEQLEAIRKAKELEEYEQRAQAAREELQSLQK